MTLHLVNDNDNESESDDQSITLSQRQIDILSLIADGYTNEQLAHELGITYDGVRFHLKALYRKFGVSNRAHLMAIVLTNHLLSSSTTPSNYGIQVTTHTHNYDTPSTSVSG